MNIHNYDNLTNIHNFFFHPLHRKGSQKAKTVLAIITNVFITIATGGLWQIPFWIVNRLDHKRVKQLNKSKTPQVNTATTSAGVFPKPNPPSTPPAQSPVNPANSAPEKNAVAVSEVKIPEELNDCFDILFGKGVLEKIPVFPRQINQGEAGFTTRIRSYSEEGSRDYLTEMTFPIMKAIGADGSPIIILKVMAENPEAHYDAKYFPGKDKATVVNELKTKEYAVIFREYCTRDELPDDLTFPLLWMQWNFADPSAPRLFAVVNLTDDDGTLQMDGEGGIKTRQIRAFQSLFQNGVGKDSNRNVKWRIPNHDQIKALFS